MLCFSHCTTPRYKCLSIQHRLSPYPTSLFFFLIGNRLEANLRKLVRASFFQNEGVVIFKKHTEYVGGKFSTLPEKERI